MPDPAERVCPGPDSTPDDRVDWCTHLMATNGWHGYPTRIKLAAHWGQAESTVRNYAAEAHRRLKLDPEELSQWRTLHAITLQRIRDVAMRNVDPRSGLHDFSSAIRAVELMAKFQGIDLDTSATQAERPRIEIRILGADAAPADSK